jgi:hypothetical protein
MINESYGYVLKNLSFENLRRKKEHNNNKSNAMTQFMDDCIPSCLQMECLNATKMAPNSSLKSVNALLFSKTYWFAKSLLRNNFIYGLVVE